MTEPIKLFRSAADQLRLIADEIDENPDISKNATVIFGSDVYQCMDQKIDVGNAAREAIFNCNFAIAKLMSAAVNGDIK